MGEPYTWELFMQIMYSSTKTIYRSSKCNFVHYNTNLAIFL